MGRRGQGKLRRTVLGSVSDFVIHHIHCPIIVSRTWLVVVVQRDVLCFRLKVFPLNRLPDTDFFGIMEENLHVHHCDCVHSLSIFVMKWIFSMNWGCFYIPMVSSTGCCWVPCYYCVSIFILTLNMMCEMVQDLWTWFTWMLKNPWLIHNTLVDQQIKEFCVLDRPCWPTLVSFEHDHLSGGAAAIVELCTWNQAVVTEQCVLKSLDVQQLKQCHAKVTVPLFTSLKYTVMFRQTPMTNLYRLSV